MTSAPEPHMDGEPVGVDEPPEPARKRRRVVRTLGGILAWCLVVAVVAVVWILQGAGGQRLALDAVLSRVERSLAGELSVQGIRSNSLLFSATLTGVRLEAAEGRPFFEADSVEVRYSALGLLRGRRSLVGLTLWSPRIEVSTYPGDDGPNVSRLLLPADGGRGAGTPRDMPLGTVVIHDGLLAVLSPANGTPSARIPTVPVPDGAGVLRRLALEAIQGEWRDAVLHTGDEVRFTAALDAVAMDVMLLEEPLRIVDGSGNFAFGSAGVEFGAATVDLPGSRLSGSLRLGPTSAGEPWRFFTDLNAATGDLDDLRWLDSRIPAGSFTGRFEVRTSDAIDVVFHRLEAEVEGSQLAAEGAFRFDSGLEFRDFNVTASPLAVSRLEPWLGRTLPIDGWLSGRLVLDGTPSALATNGNLTLVPTGYGGRPTSADVGGVLHLGGNPGATDFAGRLDPLNFNLLQALLPSVSIRGAGSVAFEVSGRAEDGFRFTSDLVERRNPLATTRVHAEGTAVRDSLRLWNFDVEGKLTPLSLELANQVYPALEVQGDLRGTVHLSGPLQDLRATAEVDVAGGRVTVDAGADLTSLARGYQLDLQVDAVDFAQVVSRVPAPATWTGQVVVMGSGLTPDSLEAEISLAGGHSRVGRLYVDTVGASLHTSAGLLHVDSLFALLGGVSVGGSGAVGLAGAHEGEASFWFETDSLIHLRSIFMGDSVIARDELSALDREVLRFEGIDPDTLPLAEEVAMSGAVSGTVDVYGALDDLDVTLSARLQDGVFRQQSLGEAEILLEAQGLPARSGEWNLVADAADLDLARWAYEGAHVELRGEGASGSGWFEVRRTEVERYGASGGFSVDSAGGSIDLELATARVDSVQWSLERPTRLTWDSSFVRVDDLVATSDAVDPGRITASLVLSRASDSDFTLGMDGVKLGRLARLAQFDSRVVAGDMNVAIRVRGPGDDPTIDANVTAESILYGDLSADRVVSEVRYAGRAAEVSAEAWSKGRSVLTAAGTIPIDLSLVVTENRVPSLDSMEVRVEADSLEVAGLLATVSALENVDGWVSGGLDIGGTILDPAPSGTLRVERANWAVPALGVRHTNVSGLMTLFPDRTVEVSMASRGSGTSEITGRLNFSTVANPALDLTIAFQQFPAVNRRDLTGTISGATTLTGTFRRPVIRGSLSVDQGALFLEEFARSAQVVDLTDPSLFQASDTLGITGRPLIAELRNPFMDSLRVDVELAVDRNTWLRSPEMNVEIGGDLTMVYDRSEREVVMVGDLGALRGSYSVLGRRFEVETGSVGFIGVPGINPTLDIEAISRIRRVDGDPLDVTATVTGTLIQPRVTLSSEEQGLGESDLVSYLIFGRPTHELATGQQAALGGAVAGAWSVATGTVATAFSTAVAQGVGIDYLSISQAGDFAGFQGFQGSFAGTQVEVGQYLSADVFVVVVLRPLQDQTANSGAFGGARVEWALSDNLTLEGFIEDRFLRNQSLGAADLAPLARRVLGVFVFREWGY